MTEKRIRKISVAMTTYKPKREFLVQQLDSIRSQTLSVDEVVITDDASKDGTVDFLREYVNEHSLSSWIVQEHEENKRVRTSFKDSMRTCTGDLIFLCDQDDVWEDTKVERFADIFNAYEDAHCLLGNYVLIDENSERISISDKGDNLFFSGWDGKVGDNLYHVAPTVVLAHNIAPGATQALSQEVARTFLKSKGHGRMHDWCIDIVASLQFDGLYYTDEVLTRYRQHSSNTVGVRNTYLMLPGREGVIRGVVWNVRSLGHVLSLSWKRRRDPYNRFTRYEIDSLKPRDNDPETIRDCYFENCDPSDDVLSQFEAWERYVKALKRAVKLHSFPRFVKLRTAGEYKRFHKDHFQYWRWQERLACLLKDFNWCLFGWRQTK